MKNTKGREAVVNAILGVELFDDPKQETELWKKFARNLDGFISFLADADVQTRNRALNPYKTKKKKAGRKAKNTDHALLKRLEIFEQFKAATIDLNKRKYGGEYTDAKAIRIYINLWKEKYSGTKRPNTDQIKQQSKTFKNQLGAARKVKKLSQ